MEAVDNNTVPDTKIKNFGRRGTLKLLLAGIAAAASYPALNRLTEPSFLYDSVNQLEYSGESNKIISSVWKDFGVYMNSQKTWLGKENLRWDTEELACVADALTKFPKEYFMGKNAPQIMYLVRPPATSGDSAGGNYANRSIVLQISETHKLGVPFEGMFGEVYGDSTRQLQSTLFHEWTHAWAMDMDTSIFENWIRAVGWFHTAGGEWENRHPELLMPEAEADKKPWEDLAVSASRLFSKPSTLSPDRLDFFLKTNPYKDWERLAGLKSTT